MPRNRRDTARINANYRLTMAANQNRYLPARFKSKAGSQAAIVCR
jgi:hypothetical protein